MTAILDLPSLSGVYGAIGAALAGIFAILAAWVAGKRSGRQKADLDAMKAETKARAKGDAAVAESKATGKPWQDRLKDHKR